jgi:two-component system nitrogen regulation response regulator GlnG
VETEGKSVRALTDIAQFVEQLLRDGEGRIYRKVSHAVDHAILQAVLRETKGNQAKACQMLGISRTTLRAKLQRLGVVIEKQILSISESPSPLARG